MKNAKPQNPCRSGTAAHAIMAVLLRAKGKPVGVAEIAKRAKLNQDKAKQVVYALTNPLHCCRLTRAGWKVTHSDAGFEAGRCKADPEARRVQPKKKVSKKSTKKQASKRPAKRRKEQHSSPPAAAAAETTAVPAADEATAVPATAS